IDLDAGQQRTAAFKALNPQMVLPALVEDDGNVLFQSMAIMEYLDEIHPEPPLLPSDPRGRARVRSLSLITVADSHPLIVPRLRPARPPARGPTSQSRGGRKVWGGPPLVCGGS